MSNENKMSLAIIPRTLDESADLAERFAKSTLLPKSMQGKAPDVLVTIMAGAEMGLAPMASLRSIHVIEGKPVLSADGMIAIILGSGKAVYFSRVEESDTSVTYETLRVGAKSPQRCTWTLVMAKSAGLHLKDNWRAYPRAMLASRAKAELARDVFPDVLAGCYTIEESESFNSAPRPEYQAPAKVERIDDAEIVTPIDSALASIADAETVEELKALTKSLAKLSNGDKTAALAAYKERLAVLEHVPAPVANGATEVAAP